MPAWKYTIRLADVWKNEDLTFEQRRDEIALRLKNSTWASGNPLVAELAFDLSQAKDAADFDDIWNDVYDEADRDRAWIAIH